MNEPLDTKGLPFVSILVVNYNGISFIGGCLESLLNQSYLRFEVVVIDNGSTDGSVETLQHYVPNIRLILNEKNLGFAAANNIGIKEAKGEMIVLFNNDAVADKNWLAELVRSTLSTPEVGIVSGPIYYLEPKDVLWGIAGCYDMLTGLSWHLGQYEKEICLTDDFDYIPFCAALIKKEVFSRIGLLDERFFMYCEDVDFCLRARKAGFTLKIALDAIAWHAASASMRKEPGRRNLLNLQSEFKLSFKVLPLVYLPLNLFLRLTAVPIALILFLSYPADYLKQTWQAFITVALTILNDGKGHFREKNPLWLSVRLGELMRLIFRRKNSLRQFQANFVNAR